ncbi:MAG: hypothetical protein WDN75_13385 [Bacteroidota bacterium]
MTRQSGKRKTLIHPSISTALLPTPGTGENSLLKDIVAWAKQSGKAQGKKFIRMDTFGDNQKLIDYYVACGFNFSWAHFHGSRR